MTYCIDFFRKFKKDGNFCGLDKSQVSRLTAYLEIVELLMKQKIPEEQIYENLSVKAAEPLISAKSEARTKGLNYVTAQLKNGKKVTNNDVQVTLKSCINATTTPSVPVEKKLEISNKKKDGFPEHVPPAAVTVPIPSDPAKPPQPSLAAQQAAKVPAAPIAAVLKQKFSQPEQHVGHTDVAINPVVIDDSKRQAPPFKCTGQVCNGERIKHEDLRGNVCNVLGVSCNQISKCPLLDPLTGAKIVRLPGIKIVPTPMTDQERNAWADAGISRGGFFTKKEVEQIDELVKVHYEGIKSRADFFWRAASWFLASTGGE